MSLETSPVTGVTKFYGPSATTNFLDNKFTSDDGNLNRSPARFKNAFINEYPTLLVRPYDSSENQLFTSSTLSGGSVAVDNTVIDPTTGSPMAKITIPNLNSSYQAINYYNQDLGFFEDTDIWLLSVYIPAAIQGSCLIQLLTTEASSIAGTNFRTYQFNASGMQQGWNLLSMRHVETLVGSTQYGTVGTNIMYAWINGGTQSQRTAVNSMRMRCIITGGASGDTDIYFGAIHKAKKDWCKGAVIWMADDVPDSFRTNAIPIIKSYGWKTTLNISPGLPAENSNYISLNNVRELRNQGHEIWGHTYTGENLVGLSTAEETRVLTIARNYWNSVGIYSAAKYMSYVQGDYNADTITALKTLGYKMAATITGRFMSPWMPGVNPYTLSRFSAEQQNSWQVDTLLNGGILRGQAMFTYMHTPVAGGSTSNTYPGATSFYTDHLKRWCDLVKSHEEADRVIVCTGEEYFKLCGIDPLIDTFTE